MMSDEAPPPRRFRFVRTQRVRQSAVFTRAMREGRRVVDHHLIVWTLPNDLPHARLGLIVGRRHGNAPHRNRLKRLIREAFRLEQHELPPGVDLLVSPKAGVTLTLAAARTSLRRVAERCVRQRRDA